MADETRIFAVGLTQAEQRLLAGICAISQRRLRKLKLIDADEIASADIFLVDENSEDYAQYKETILNLSKNRPLVLHKLLIFIDGNHNDNVSLPRPIEWNRLPERIANLLDNHKRKKIAEIARQSAEDDTQAVIINEKEGDTISRILVVDDSILVREQLTKILTEHGYLVTTASSGEDALQLFKANYYRKVLLDVVMPEADGYEICRKLRTIDKNTPVIMLTSKSSPFDKIRGKMAGCQAYLTKPVTLDKLLVKLHS